MNRRTFEIVHTIPSPYRLHLFSTLDSELRSRNVDMFVHFFAMGHRDRPNSWSNPQISFPHRFWKDYGPRRGDYVAHFNPGLVGSLLTKTPDYLLVGGPWDTPTGLLVSLLARRRTGIAWVEGNTHTPGRIKGLAGHYKRWVLSNYHFVAVPGDEGIRYVELLRGNDHRSRPMPVILPNLVDETRFRATWTIQPGIRTQTRESLGIDPGERLALWPARLNPVKGILEFLSTVEVGLLSGWKIIIIGEGPLREPIEDLVKQRRLEANVLLKGYGPYEEMPGLYNAADLFILASVYDPNPLSVVEAMHSGLPLLLSNRVGNFPEALAEGENGWGFNPGDQDMVRAAAAKAFTASAEQLVAMGRQSKLRAMEFWNSGKAIRDFVDSIGIHPK